jgi:hypothetical protein
VLYTYVCVYIVIYMCVPVYIGRAGDVIRRAQAGGIKLGIGSTRLGYIYIYIYIYVHTYVYIYVCVYMCVYVYMCIKLQCIHIIQCICVFIVCMCICV